MLFHTYVFLVFFVVAFAGHALLRTTRLGRPWIVLASFVFYGWWSPLYLVPMAASTVVDWAVARRLPASSRPRRLLLVSLVSNLGLLAFFKYAGFVADTIGALASLVGLELAPPRPGVALPVGISFYTFQSIAYVVDVYRGRLAPERSLLGVAAYVAFFPQLVAGPIERADRLLPQLARPPAPTVAGASAGLSLFVVGLFKKLAIADLLALYVDRVYAAPERAPSLALVAATFAFAWQIYFDFSGYTDMARGVARALGFELVENFHRPYVAASLSDFWRRWHVSLSTWFRDYVYVPLGGNRGGRGRTERNLMVTMILSGLWHGAGWTFALWGALHGVGLVVERRLRASGDAAVLARVPLAVRRAAVFAFVCVGWVFFRARSPGEALAVLRGVLAAAPGDAGFPIWALVLCAAVWLHQAATEARPRAPWLVAPVRVGLAAGMILYLTLFTGSADQPFLYFQF